MNSIFNSLNKAVDNFFIKANLKGKDLAGFAIGEVANKVNAVVNNFFVGLSASVDQADEKIKGQLPQLCDAFTKALNDCQCKTRGEVDNVLSKLQQIVSQLPLTDKSPQVLDISKSMFVNPGDTESITFSGVFKIFKSIKTVPKLTILNQDNEEWDCKLSGNETDHKLVFEIPKKVFAKDLAKFKVSKVRAKLEIPLETWVFARSVNYNFTLYAIQKSAGKVKVVFEDTIQEPIVKTETEQYVIHNKTLNKVTFSKAITPPLGWQVVPNSMSARVSIDTSSFNVVSCEVDHKLNSCQAVIKGKHKRHMPSGTLVIDYKVTKMITKQISGERPEENINFDEPCLFPILSGTKRITLIQLTDIFNCPTALNISQNVIIPKTTEGYFTITREYGRLTVLASSGEVVRCIPGNYFKASDKKSQIPALPQVDSLACLTASPQTAAAASSTQTTATASSTQTAAAASTQTAAAAKPEGNSYLTKGNMSFAVLTISLALWLLRKK